MGKIKVLERNVSDKIAAGEVVERPASVIKELLENAVDAGATTVCVEIKGGGILYMRVTDNGTGMTKEDVSLCVVRHATSKIATEEDLGSINTLGFRGEALSSIAAVSRLELYTKTRQDTVGTHLTAHNGEIVSIDEAGCPDGTTVVVRELFSTVPARMKFLKKDFTEAGYIEDIVSRLALSHPEISVKLINNGKEVLFTPGDNLLSSAVYAVYGKDIKNAMLDARFEERGVCVFGVCATAAAARNNRSMENFFVNGRYIKSALLSRAVEEAYKNELMSGKFPACVFNLTLPPETVDINIHPTKLEAKFADEKHIYHCVYWAAKNALYRSTSVPEASEHKSIKPQFTRPQPVQMPKPNTGKPQTGAAFREPSGYPAAHTAHVPSASAALFVEKQSPVQKKTSAEDWAAQNAANGKDGGRLDETGAGTPDFLHIQMAPEKAGATRADAPILPFASLEKTPAEKTAAQEPKKNNAFLGPDGQAAHGSFGEQTPLPFVGDKPVYKICGQVFKTYIIVEKDGKMLMVDQHAAHERLRYEALLAQYRTRNVTSQLLLCPEVIDLTPPEFAIFCENREAICDLGFLAEEFGQKQIIVRGTPAEAGACNPKDTMLEILSLFAANRKQIDDDLAATMLYRIACRGAVKANAALSQAEMTQLLDDVFRLSGIHTCPHGRPIMIEFTKEFIEKQFKRIV